MKVGGICKKNICIFILVVIFFGINAYAEITVVVGGNGGQTKEFKKEIGMSLLAFSEDVRTSGFDPDSLVFIKKTGAGVNIMSLIKRSADITFADLDIVDKSKIRFLASPLKTPTKESILSNKRVQFAKIIYDDYDKSEEMKKLLEEFKDAQGAMKFVSSCKSEDKDGAKNALYLAARKGNLQTIKEIRSKLGDHNFLKLLKEETLQKQTVLHAAARATKNAVEVINYILDLAPDLLDNKNVFKCTAFDVAIIFGLRDPARLAALKGLPSEKDSRFVKISPTIGSGCKDLK